MKKDEFDLLIKEIELAFNENIDEDLCLTCNEWFILTQKLEEKFVEKKGGEQK